MRSFKCSAPRDSPCWLPATSLSARTVTARNIRLTAFTGVAARKPQFSTRMARSAPLVAPHTSESRGLSIDANFSVCGSHEIAVFAGKLNPPPATPDHTANHFHAYHTVAINRFRAVVVLTRLSTPCTLGNMCGILPATVRASLSCTSGHTRASGHEHYSGDAARVVPRACTPWCLARRAAIDSFGGLHQSPNSSFLRLGVCFFPRKIIARMV